MRLPFVIWAACLLTGCSSFEKTEPEKNLPGAREMLELYAHESRGMSWVSDKCDSLGFTALCKLYGGCAAANIHDAEVNGRWYRHPDKDCLGTESKSDMSRDHLLMLISYFESTGDVESLKRMRNYLEENKWISGNHDGSIDGMNRVLTASLASTLIDTINHLENKKSLSLSFYEKLGFEAHLEALHIRHRGRIYGEITGGELDNLKKHIERVPDNMLFKAIAARYGHGSSQEVWEGIKNSRYCPTDRLPTSADRCGDYVYQREPDSNAWKPCPEEMKMHPGNDCAMALRVLLDD